MYHTANSVHTNTYSTWALQLNWGAWSTSNLLLAIDRLIITGLLYDDPPLPVAGKLPIIMQIFDIAC